MHTKTIFQIVSGTEALRDLQSTGPTSVLWYSCTTLLSAKTWMEDVSWKSTSWSSPRPFPYYSNQNDLHKHYWLPQVISEVRSTLGTGCKPLQFGGKLIRQLRLKLHHSDTSLNYLCFYVNIQSSFFKGHGGEYIKICSTVLLPVWINPILEYEIEWKYSHQKMQQSSNSSTIFSRGQRCYV